MRSLLFSFPVPMSKSISTLLEAFCNHCRVMKGHSKYTIAGYRDAIKSFVKYTASESVEEITLESVERWIATGTTESNWAAKTSRGRIRYMILFCKWLVTRKVLPENPIEGISLPRVPKKIPRHLSLDEAEHLLRVLRNHRYRSKFESVRAYAVVAMFLFTGVRKLELRKLELRDVDLDAGVVSVRSGKGSKDRLVAVPPQLREALAPYLRLRCTRRWNSNPYFFVGLQGTGMLGDKVLRRTIKKARKASGIYFAPHMLRHTYATLMLEGGCDLFSLSKLMGHADIKTTTIYLAATVQHLQEQVVKHPVMV